MEIERNWKIKLNQLIQDRSESTIISVKIDGNQLKISTDGKTWLKMGAVKALQGFPSQYSATFEDPMVWDEQTEDVVSSKR